MFIDAAGRVPHVDAGRMNSCRLPGLLDIDGSLDGIDCFYTAKFFSALIQILSSAHFGFLLVVDIAVYRNLALYGYSFGETQARQSDALVEQSIVIQFSQSITFPPARFVLSPVPIQELRQHPARLLLTGTLRGIEGDATRELFYQCSDALLAFVQILGGSTIANRRPGDYGSAVLQLCSLLFQPISEGGSGSAIVLVVSLHGHAQVLREVSIPA